MLLHRCLASTSGKQVLGILLLFLGGCDRRHRRQMETLGLHENVQEHQVPHSVIHGVIITLRDHAGKRPQINNQPELSVNFYYEFINWREKALGVAIFIVQCIIFRYFLLLWEIQLIYYIPEYIPQNSIFSSYNPNAVRKF